MTDAPATREHPWPVGLLSAKLKDYLDRLGTVWVEGEITQWGVSGGNVYGKLKDLEGDATISFTMWSSVRARLGEQFKQGDHAILLVKPTWGSASRRRIALTTSGAVRSPCTDA